LVVLPCIHCSILIFDWKYSVHPDPTELFPVRTRGRRHGPITRLMSPGDLGERLKPFVFLDAVDLRPGNSSGFGWHPHSGIATATVTFEGTLWAEESTGVRHRLPPGGLEWMQAGLGVWHRGGPTPDTDRVAGFQLWLALGAAAEREAPAAQYFPPENMPIVGPVRVVLGSHEGRISPAAAPAGLTYLQVKLQPGERVCLTPDGAQDVAFLALHSGTVRVEASGRSAVLSGTELAVFASVPASIELTATEPSWLVYGAAPRHPHPLALGRYSVHTSPAALREGEQQIQRLRRSLQARFAHS